MMHLIYEAWVRFQIWVQVWDSTIFEKVECECDCDRVGD